MSHPKSAYEKIDLDAVIKFWSRDKLIGAIGYGQNHTTIEAVMGLLGRQNKGRKGQKLDIQDMKVWTITAEGTNTQGKPYKDVLVHDKK